MPLLGIQSIFCDYSWRQRILTGQVEITNNYGRYRAVVVERSNALVYLMISVLELKVEGSNPASSVLFWAK